MRNQFLLFIFMLCLSAHADDFAYLSFVTDDGTTKSFTAQGAEITFADGKAVVTSGAESEAFELSALNRMFFSNEKDEANEDTEPYVVINGISTADTSSAAFPVVVYTLSSMQVGTFADMNAALSQLNRGIYVMKQNGKTQKIAVR